MPRTVTCLEGFADEPEAAFTADWSNELLQYYTDYSKKPPT